MFNKNKKEDFNYFDEFAKNSTYSLECTKLLSSITENYDKNNLREKLIGMHVIENKADSSKHDMINYLMKDFLPPIEREDIICLSQKMDDVVDLLEEILINLDMFNISELRGDFKDFISNLNEVCEVENKLLIGFKNFRKANSLKDIIIEINKKEEAADTMYFEAMRKLYREDVNSIDIMKWTTIYNILEDCFDAIESVANSIESIILKNI